MPATHLSSGAQPGRLTFGLITPLEAYPDTGLPTLKDYGRMAQLAAQPPALIVNDAGRSNAVRIRNIGHPDTNKMAVLIRISCASVQRAMVIGDKQSIRRQLLAEPGRVFFHHLVHDCQCIEQCRLRFSNWYPCSSSMSRGRRRYKGRRVISHYQSTNANYGVLPDPAADCIPGSG